MVILICIAIFAMLSVSFGLKTQQDNLKLFYLFPILQENLDFQLSSLMKDKIFNQPLITRFCPDSQLLVDRLYVFLNYTMIGLYCWSCRADERVERQMPYLVHLPSTFKSQLYLSCIYEWYP